MKLMNVKGTVDNLPNKEILRRRVVSVAPVFFAH